MSKQNSNSIRQRSVLALALVVMLFTLACDLGLGNFGQISFGAPTPSRTRTPRPTFTIRPESTATPEDTVTPAPTETPAKTATNTRAPVVVVPRTNTPARPAPTAPPALPVKLVLNYGCGQDGIYEIVGSIRRPSSVWLGGYVMGLLSPDGRILKTDTSLPDDQKTMPFDISCQRSGVLPLNLKIDATEYRAKGPFIVRIIKSSSDPTPLSPDVTIDLSTPGRTFIFYDVP